jgi:PncC family amidohydrolase
MSRSVPALQFAINIRTGRRLDRHLPGVLGGMRTSGTEGGERGGAAAITELAEAVAALLDGRTIAAAESCTAGRVAAALATAEGAAEFFRGGLVAYQVAVKQQLLGVSSPKVLNLRAAEEMATGAAQLLGAPVAVATTGVAGGDPVDGVPPGTVFIGTVVDDVAASARHWFPGEPEEVCAAAAEQALRDLVAALQERTGDVRRPPEEAALIVQG